MVDQAHESHCRARSQKAASRHGLRRRNDRRHSLPARWKSPAPGWRPRPHRGGAQALAAALERFGARVCYNGRNVKQDRRGLMDERSFYTEKEEIRKVKLVCPSCRGEFEAPVRWKVCRKRKELPRGAGEEDRRKFAKATSYMVRLEDLVACYKCRKRFELTGQSTVLINGNLGDPNEDPENFGNR